MLKNHVLGYLNLNNSEISGLSFEDIFFGNTRHLYKKNKPTLGSSGGGVHGKVCWLIAYYSAHIELFQYIFNIIITHSERALFNLNARVEARGTIVPKAVGRGYYGPERQRKGI